MTTRYKNIEQIAGRSILLIMVCIMLFAPACKKYLDKKPIKSAVIPTTLNDLQGLLDNSNVLNIYSPAAMSELVADNYYLTTDDWKSEYDFDTEAPLNYIWDKDVLSLTNFNSWGQAYQNAIYYSNIVLDQLPLVNVNADEAEKYRNIKGSALFFRAFIFQSLAQVYCKPYSTDNANDLGIVLKLTSNVSEKVTRATIQQTYDRIIADLKEATDLLPVTTLYPTRPSKTAAYAALARTFLSMRDYTNAGMYANLALQQYNVLMDYNTLIPVGNPVINYFNPEVIFHSVTSTPYVLGYLAKIDSILYQSYDINDLRKIIFFNDNGDNTYSFRGSYYGLSSTSIFDGLTTDELYLIRAESYARAGNTASAMADLNLLLQKRWKTGSFTDMTATDAADALNKILAERRKELIYRGLRWSDVRRFNLEGANIVLKRVVDNVTYTLPPNDLRIALLIPFNEINRSGITQNPR